MGSFWSIFYPYIQVSQTISTVELLITPNLKKDKPSILIFVESKRSKNADRISRLIRLIIGMPLWFVKARHAERRLVFKAIMVRVFSKLP